MLGGGGGEGGGGADLAAMSSGIDRRMAAQESAMAKLGAQLSEVASAVAALSQR